MRIASYNIRKAVGLDWRRDADRILGVLHEVGGDIVVLQEADRRLGRRAGVLPLEQLESDLGLILADVSARPDSHGWHGNAILVQKHHTVSDISRIELPSVEPRGAVSVTLDEPRVEIMGTHLGLTPGVRRKQMAALVDHMVRATGPVLLAGDFNEWKVAETQFEHPVEMIVPGPSFHASRPSAALDRFLISGPIKHKSSHVHNSTLARRASDHLPVVIEIELEGTSW